MNQEDSVIDAVERLERAVTRLEKILLAGDSDVGTPGMLHQHRQLVADMEEIKARRPKPASWVIGYAIFSVGLIPLIKEVREYLGIDYGAVIIFLFISTAVALYFFANGLGFVRWTQ